MHTETLDSRTMVSCLLYEAFRLGFDEDNPISSLEYNTYASMIEFSINQITNGEVDLKGKLQSDDVDEYTYMYVEDYQEIMHAVKLFESTKDSDTLTYFAIKQTNIIFSRYLSMKYNLDFVYHINETFQAIENSYYNYVTKDIDVKTKININKRLVNKKCQNCNNSNCNATSTQVCPFWNNDSLTGKSYSFDIRDINRLNK